MKKIIITSNKFIPSKGIHGPVLTPYMETPKEICKMLARGIVVEEVLENGEHRRLDVSSALEGNDKLVTTVQKVTQPVVNKVENVQSYNNNRKDKKKNKKRENLGFEVDTFESK